MKIIKPIQIYIIKAKNGFCDTLCFNYTGIIYSIPITYGCTNIHIRQMVQGRLKILKLKKV